MKEWFKARNIWGAAIMALSDAEAGRLAKALWWYTMSGEQQNLSGAEKGIFAMIQLTLSQDEIRDADISEKRSRATDSIRKQKISNDIESNQMISNDIKTDQMISNDDNKNKNKNKDKESDTEIKNRRFTPPSVEEVSEYCRERNNKVDAQQFIDFYTSKGWKVGNTPMRDWKACVRTWEKRDSGANKIKPLVPAQQYSQRDYSEAGETLEELMRRVGGL